MHYELSEEEKFYRNGLTRMPDGLAALEEAYRAVEGIVTEVEQYVKVGGWHYVVLHLDECGLCSFSLRIFRVGGNIF